LALTRTPLLTMKKLLSSGVDLPENLDKLERVVWAENPANPHDFAWTMGGDGISRVWHPGVHETETWGWAGAPDIVAEYKGKVVLGDLKTSNGLVFQPSGQDLKL
jgi:hypothetical protein